MFNQIGTNRHFCDLAGVARDKSDPNRQQALDAAGGAHQFLIGLNAIPGDDFRPLIIDACGRESTAAMIVTANTVRSRMAVIVKCVTKCRISFYNQSLKLLRRGWCMREPLNLRKRDHTR